MRIPHFRLGCAAGIVAPFARCRLWLAVIGVMAINPASDAARDWDEPYAPKYVWHLTGYRNGDGPHENKNEYHVGTREMKLGLNVRSDMSGFGDWRGDALSRDYNRYYYTDWVGGP